MYVLTTYILPVQIRLYIHVCFSVSSRSFQTDQQTRATRSSTVFTSGLCISVKSIGSFTPRFKLSTWYPEKKCPWNFNDFLNLKIKKLLNQTQHIRSDLSNWLAFLFLVSFDVPTFFYYPLLFACTWILWRDQCIAKYFDCINYSWAFPTWNTPNLSKTSSFFRHS